MPKIEKFPAKISCNSQPARDRERERGGKKEKKDEIIRNFYTFFPPSVDWVFLQNWGEEEERRERMRERKRVENSILSDQIRGPDISFL